MLSKKQRQVAAELQANGATVWMARTVDAALTALALSVSSRGNVRSETLRAFSFDEMKKILGKLV